MMVRKEIAAMRSEMAALSSKIEALMNNIDRLYRLIESVDRGPAFGGSEPIALASRERDVELADIVKRWRKSLEEWPQYAAAILDCVDDIERTFPGLFAKNKEPPK